MATTAASTPSSVPALDLDADRKPDLAVANHSSGTVSVLLDKGKGTFAARPDLAFVNENSDTVSALFGACLP